MGLDREKVEVYEILLDMLIKFLLAVAALACFVAFAIFFILSVRKDSYMQATFFGTMDFIFGVIIFLVYRHYFMRKRRPASN